MLNILTYRLLLVASLFMLLPSIQALAADKPEQILSSVQVTEKTNINQASNKELSEINGIGASKAKAIVDYREKNGDFSSIEELIKVKGIGQSTLQKITPFISL
jgi:competence protein ComEA